MAFPNNQNIPAACFKIFKMLLVTLLRPLEFRKPKILIGFWNARNQTAVRCMLMPKTAVYKNQVRLSRQTFSMKSVTIAKRMNKLPDSHFRLHILAADLPHIFASALFGQLVSHLALARTAHELFRGGFFGRFLKKRYIAGNTVRDSFGH